MEKTVHFNSRLLFEFYSTIQISSQHNESKREKVQLRKYLLQEDPLKSDINLFPLSHFFVVNISEYAIIYEICGFVPLLVWLSVFCGYSCYFSFSELLWRWCNLKLLVTFSHYVHLTKFPTVTSSSNALFSSNQLFDVAENSNIAYFA